MKKYYLIFLSIFTLFSCSSNVDEAEVKKAQQFFESVFQDQVLDSPEFQASLGFKSNYDKWDDITWQKSRELSRRAADDLKFMKKNIDFDKIDEETKISYKLMEKRLQRTIDSDKFIFHGYMVTHRGGKHSSIPSFLINYHRMDEVQDVKDYISRLRNVEPLMDDLMEQLRLRQDVKKLAPAFVYPQAIKTSENIISGYPFEEVENQNVIYEDFMKKLNALDISDAEKLRYQSEVEAVLLTIVNFSYRKFIDFLKDQQTLADNNHGVWKFEDGAEYYQHALDGYTTLGLTAEEVHEIGLSEVARIHEEIYQIMEKVNFEGTLKEFFDFMREDPQFYYPEGPVGRQMYLDQVNVVVDTLSNRIEELFYGLPSIEAIPGHHMQISIQLEVEDMPSFRKYGGYSVFSEGWALYSETLPKEIGLYKDPYSDFGRLSGELWRACRLVVDTGVHHYRWTREEGIDYYMNNTANPEGDCIGMVERHIVWPGQAVSYKIGMLKVQELRAFSEQELGDKFSLQEFHDIVLRNGSVTMDVLEEIVVSWVNSK